MKKKMSKQLWVMLTILSAYVLSTAAQQAPQTQTSPDAIEEAQRPRNSAPSRPEQNKSAHDQSAIFSAPSAKPASDVSDGQPKQGKISGFDFYRDPLNADQPNVNPAEIVKNESANKPNVMNAQRQLLETRYVLTPNTDPTAKMSRGKPIPVGPTAKLPSGMTWDQMASLAPSEISKRNIFPYRALPHPLQVNGGQVFPKMQVDMFPRLERFDVEFDLPDAFVPEFPPAIFLSSRPELGDVSRGEVISINNYYRLFKDLLTPVQLDGLRLLLTPFPQEEFNPTDDRKTVEPSLGVACLDCHVNGHTTAQFHLTPDMRPQERRFRLDTVSLRGVNSQQIHGSKRSLRSVEDFTEFEQRTA